MFNQHFYIGQCAHDLTIENGIGSIQKVWKSWLVEKKTLATTWSNKLCLYYTLHGIQTYNNCLRWSSDQISSKRSQAPSSGGVRLPRQGTWLPSVLWWSRERWHSGKKASCSVGWVCLQLGDVTLRNVQRVVFFSYKKNWDMSCLQ